MGGRTGLIPATFADQAVRYRVPYSMPGEFLISASQSGQFFPEGTFLHNVDKPFEIWKVRVSLSALLNGTLLTTQPALIDMLNKIRVSTLQDTSKNETLIKASHLLTTLITSTNGFDATWEWYVPYTMIRSQGFQIGFDSQAFPNTFDQLRIEWAFQGYLDVIQPASESR